MKLLRNRRAYRRWSREAWDTYNNRWNLHEPTAYPCYAFTVVEDWGMEELRPEYLYAADIDLMASDLRKHTRHVDSSFQT